MSIRSSIFLVPFLAAAVAVPARAQTAPPSAQTGSPVVQAPAGAAPRAQPGTVQPPAPPPGSSAATSGPPASPPAAQPGVYGNGNTTAQPGVYGNRQPTYPVYGAGGVYYPPPTRRGRVQRPIVGYRSVERADPRLWGSGLAMFLAGWVLDFAAITPIANAISDDRDPGVEQDSWAWSLLPIVGPIVQLGLQAPHPAIPITLELLQLTGAGLLIAGLVTNQTIRVPIYAGDPEDPNMSRIELSARPVAGGATVGVVYRHL